MRPIQRTGLPTAAHDHHEMYTWTVRLDEHPNPTWVAAFLAAKDSDSGIPPEVNVLGRRLRYTSDLETSPLWLISIDRWIAKANREIGR